MPVGIYRVQSPGFPTEDRLMMNSQSVKNADYQLILN